MVRFVEEIPWQFYEGHYRISFVFFRALSFFLFVQALDVV
jgi:hypothetical protein